jgi:hypothetical protein
MPFLAILIVLILAPTLGHAQRIETTWAVGGSVAAHHVVQMGQNTGRLRPAALVEIGAYYEGKDTRRLGVILQILPSPSMRVGGTAFEGAHVTRSFGFPSWVMRLGTDIAPLTALGIITPSFGVGYSVYVQGNVACAAANTSALCTTAGRIHGAHGLLGHASAMFGHKRSPLALNIRYIVTRVPDVVTHDATFSVQWRGRR